MIYWYRQFHRVFISINLSNCCYRQFEFWISTNELLVSTNELFIELLISINRTICWYQQFKRFVGIDNWILDINNYSLISTIHEYVLSSEHILNILRSYSNILIFFNTSSAPKVSQNVAKLRQCSMYVKIHYFTPCYSVGEASTRCITTRATGNGKHQPWFKRR